VSVPWIVGQYRSLRGAEIDQQEVVRLTALIDTTTLVDAALAEEELVSLVAAGGVPVHVVLGGAGSASLASSFNSELAALRRGTPSIRSLAQQISGLAAPVLTVPGRQPDGSVSTEPSIMSGALAAEDEVAEPGLVQMIGKTYASPFASIPQGGTEPFMSQDAAVTRSMSTLGLCYYLEQTALGVANDVFAAAHDPVGAPRTPNIYVDLQLFFHTAGEIQLAGPSVPTVSSAHHSPFWGNFPPTYFSFVVDLATGMGVRGLGGGKEKGAAP
jgi:hypothetical protein